ncbi:MAG TPA: c-type cytochrome [Candidatus Binataceae bacterium]|nr:c-type cytochrome [Candidatus Binataceae bacterium]
MPVRASLCGPTFIVIALMALARPARGQAVGATGASPAARDQAAQIFDERCSACHGAEGRGDGPGAAALKPKPINFHNLNWQKSVSDAQIAKAIVYGGSAVGLSNQMAANPDLEDEPDVVNALVAHVRELGK